MFQHLFKTRPVSMNASSDKKREYKSNIQNELRDVIIKPVFTAGTLLRASVYYFNRDGAKTRDIHNIIKPLLDNLEGIVYDNDKQIVHFDAFRLDMSEWDEKFYFEDRNLSNSNLEYIVDGGDYGRASSILVEVQPVINQIESGIEIVWLPAFDDNDNEL